MTFSYLFLFLLERESLLLLLGVCPGFDVDNLNLINKIKVRRDNDVMLNPFMKSVGTPVY